MIPFDVVMNVGPRDADGRLTDRTLFHLGARDVMEQPQPSRLGRYPRPGLRHNRSASLTAEGEGSHLEVGEPLERDDDRYPTRRRPIRPQRVDLLDESLAEVGHVTCCQAPDAASRA